MTARYKLSLHSEGCWPSLRFHHENQHGLKLYLFLHDYFTLYRHMVTTDFKIYPNLVRPQFIYISVIPNRSHFQINITIISTKDYDLRLHNKHITHTICGILVNNLIAVNPSNLRFNNYEMELELSEYLLRIEWLT